MEEASSARTDAVQQLVEEVGGMLRLLHALKAQAVSRSAHALLFPLVSGGPVRLTTLAEQVHADPSTISRQVGELVRDDLVHREPDPDDRRACRLVVTDAGRSAVERLRQQRTAAITAALADWSPAELEAFSTSFGRFTAGLSQILSGSAADPDTPVPTSQEDR